MYLAYHLTLPLPDDFGKVQEDLNIHESGSIAISVKNPDAPASNPAAPRKTDEQKAAYPDRLRALFDTRWIPANPVELLNYPGEFHWSSTRTGSDCEYIHAGQELLLTSARAALPDSGEKEVDKPAEEDQKEVEEKEDKSDDTEKVIFDEVFGSLKAFREDPKGVEIKALEGEWA